MYLWKSILYSANLLFFSIQDAFSGQTLYPDLLYALYDVNCTNLGILIYTIFDQDVSFQDPKKGKQSDFSLSKYYEFCRLKIVSR